MTTGWKLAILAPFVLLLALAIYFGADRLNVERRLTQSEERIAAIVEALPIMRDEGLDQIDQHEQRLSKLEHPRAPPPPKAPKSREHPVLDWLFGLAGGHRK